jgi:4-amino-4-deoxy-L-arabinose transferase-like glycosyltransferase
MKLLKNPTRLILAVILLGGFIVRFYGFDNPIADWHSWRQSETAAVSRNFAQDGFDILYPRMDNISNVQSGMDNPEGYFFVEFPIYNILQAGLFTLFGIFTIEQWGRLVSMLSSVAAGLFLYLIVTKYTNKITGLFSAFFYMFIPFNIYYGRVILPDTTMTMAFLGSIYFFDKWLELYTAPKEKKQKKYIPKKSWPYFLWALLFAISALLLKPHSAFFLLPIVYLAFKAFGLAAFKKWQLYIFAVAAVAPLIAWRVWMTQFPEGIPANQWLLNGNGIRFRPSFFRWIFYERLTILISGYVGVLLLLLGVFRLPKVKDWMFLASFFASTLLFVSVVATGNVQHDYYQIPAIPSVAILMALGSYYLYAFTYRYVHVGKILLVLIIFASFYNSWNIVKEYFNINNRSILAAGEAVQRLTPEDAQIVANYNGDSAVIYQFNRKGWASFQDPVPELVKKGADYLVLINPSEQDRAQWESDYKVVEFTDQYAIFDLKNK